MVVAIGIGSCVGLVCRIFRSYGFKEKEIEKEIDVAKEQRSNTSAELQEYLWIIFK